MKTPSGPHTLLALLEHCEAEDGCEPAGKIQGPGASVKLLEVVCLGKPRDIPEAVIDKVQVYPTPSMRKRSSLCRDFGV